MGKGGDDLSQCACLACCGISTLLVIILLPASLRTVESTEFGIAYDNIWCTLHKDPLTPGLHVIDPFGSVIIWPSTQQTVEYSLANGSPLTCNSKDGIRIELDLTFQYRVLKESLYDLTLLYEDFEKYNDILTGVGRSALRHACAGFDARQFQTDRELISAKLKKEVTDKLNTMGSTTLDVQLRNVDRPNSYEDAVQAKEAARTDQSLAKSENAQALTVAMTELADAYLEANRTINRATTQAQITLNFGQAEADAVSDRYKTWADTYKAVMEAQKLTPEGILAYIGNRLVASSSSATISMPAPARTSWADGLDTSAALCSSVSGAAVTAFCGGQGLKATAADLHCRGATCTAALDQATCCNPQRREL